MTVRAATLADAPRIAEFNAAMAFETEQLRLDPAAALAGAEALIREPARGRYYLACSAGEVVGQAMITFEWSDWRNADFWWIQSVYVQPAQRGQGVFRQLYQSMEADARAARACGLRLYVEDHNTAAQATYRRLGMADRSYRVFEASF
jgi:ribosomal protein S18 acetylase RimI-like enzyme